MDDFKKGIMTKVKPLSFNQRFIEIKDDQIRIVFKPLGNNNYSVMGAFIKKDDNDRPTYNQMFRRPIAIINDEYREKFDDLKIVATWRAASPQI